MQRSGFKTMGPPPYFDALSPHKLKLKLHSLASCTQAAVAPDPTGHVEHTFKKSRRTPHTHMHKHAHAHACRTRRAQAVLAPGPIGRAEHTNEELVGILKAKGDALSPRAEAALLLVPRDLFVPKDRHREAFRDQKLTVRMGDGSTMALPPPSFVVRR